PKAISERTSYLQVRLEFLRYPHLIPALFNIRGFGPPVRFTAPSTWTWVDHMASGLRLHTQTPYSDSLSLRLRLFNLTSHAIVTRRFILQKARHHPLTGFDLLRSEEHTSELQSRFDLVCRLLLEKKKKATSYLTIDTTT